MSGLTPSTLCDDISLCTLPNGTVHLGRLLDMGWDIATIQQHGTPAARRAADAYAATARRFERGSNVMLVITLVLATLIIGICGTGDLRALGWV